MNDVERRLRAAATELRESAGKRQPQRIEEPRRRSRSGLLVFATAFAVVLVLGAIPLLLGEGPESAPEGPPLLDAPVDTTKPGPTTTAETEQTATCSADGVSASSDARSLPDSVATTRAAIIEAAMACDLTALEGHAGTGFNTSFGGGGFDNLVQWESDGDGQLDTLLRLLDMTPDVVETESGAIYVWPAAHIYDSWEEIPATLAKELEQIHSPDELSQMAGAGSYIGWRTGIDEEGNWLYFVAGD